MGSLFTKVSNIHTMFTFLSTHATCHLVPEEPHPGKMGPSNDKMLFPYLHPFESCDGPVLGGIQLLNFLEPLRVRPDKTQTPFA